MSQLPVILNQENVLPQIPSALLEELRKDRKNDFAGFGSGFRSIKARKMDFLLRDGGAQEVVPADKLFGVFLGSLPFNHYVWYEKSYTPGQEPEQPDLLWRQKDDEKNFPDALPAQFREKVLINGQMRWAFQIRRRTVWALVKQGADGHGFIDLESPYVFDIAAMSLFGKADAMSNSYKWNGIYNLCQQQSNNAFVCTPSMFITQIVLDPVAQVSGVVNFRPYRNRDGNIQYLDGALIEQIYQTRHQDSVQSLLELREILDYKQGGSDAALQKAWEEPVQQPQPAPQKKAQTLPQPTPEETFTLPTEQPQAPQQPAADPAAFDAAFLEAAVAAPATPVEPEANISIDATQSLLQQAQAILSQPIAGAAPAEPVAEPVVSPAPEAAVPTASASSMDIDALLANL